MIHQAFAIANYSTPLVEAWGDVVDIRQEQADEWRQMGWGNFGGVQATGRVDDREAGKLRPIFETERDLDELRAISRVIADSTTPGISALLNLTNYVISTGAEYSCVPKKGAAGDKTAAQEVQAIIDSFQETNNWNMNREREIFRRSLRDGENPLGLWNHDGYSEARIVDPERIREPQQVPEYGHSWSFGVDTDADDLERVYGYHVLWDGLTNELDYLPADSPAVKVFHIKRNVDSGIKRGVSDFFAVNPDLTAIRKLTRNLVKGGSVQAAIAYIVEHVPGVTTSQVESMRQTNATMRYDQTYQTGTKTRYITEDKAGTRLDVGKGQTYKGSPLANGEAASAFVEILQAGLRSIGSRWCMPEYMISGDASNANYSSTREAGTPFVKNCEAEQQIYATEYRKVMWAVVKNACEAGRLPRSYEDYRRSVEIQVKFPSIVVRDADKETTRRATLHDKGVLSKKTWAADENLDYDQELANGAKEVAPMQPFGQPQLQQPTLEAVARWAGYP